MLGAARETVILPSLSTPMAKPLVWKEIISSWPDLLSCRPSVLPLKFGKAPAPAPSAESRDTGTAPCSKLLPCLDKRCWEEAFLIHQPWLEGPGLHWTCPQAPSSSLTSHWSLPQLLAIAQVATKPVAPTVWHCQGRQLCSSSKQDSKAVLLPHFPSYHRFPFLEVCIYAQFPKLH